MTTTIPVDRNGTKIRLGASVLELMDAQLAEVTAEVQEQEYWQYFSSTETPAEQVLKIMRELLLEIWSYQQCVNESVFAAVGRKGRLFEEQPLMKAMIAVQLEEVGHGALALDDYVSLGGDREYAVNRCPSPASLVLMATVKYLGEQSDPLCHLGYMYFFERFTTIISDLAAPILAQRGYPEDRLEFVRLHAEEDVRHADMLAQVVAECEERHEGAAESILYGFDCFRRVYPHPVWDTVYRRTLEL